LKNSSETEKTVVIKPGISQPIELIGADGRVLRIVLLSEKDSLLLKRKTKTSRLEFEGSPRMRSTPVTLELVENPGTPRDWRSSNLEFKLPVAPADSDFQEASVWRLRLPEGLDVQGNPILRIHYQGDVARLLLNGRLINDNFYNGDVFEIGLRRFAPEILTGELTLQILPLQEAMPVYFEPGAKPQFNKEGLALKIERVEIVEEVAEQFAGR